MSPEREKLLKNILGVLVLMCVVVAWLGRHEGDQPSKPKAAQAAPSPEEPTPAYESITADVTTADEAFSLFKEDGCTVVEQTAKPDSRMYGSLEMKKTYDCGRAKLQLYFNRRDPDGPYYVTFMSHVY